MRFQTNIVGEGFHPLPQMFFLSSREGAEALPYKFYSKPL